MRVADTDAVADTDRHRCRVWLTQSLDTDAEPVKCGWLTQSLDTDAEPLKCGWLRKRTSGGWGWRKRWFVLSQVRLA